MMSRNTREIRRHLQPDEEGQLRKYSLLFVLFAVLLFGVTETAATRPAVDWRWIPIVQIALIFAPIWGLLITRTYMLRFLCRTEFGRAKGYDPATVSLLTWLLLPDSDRNQSGYNRAVEGIGTWRTSRRTRVMHTVVGLALVVGLSIVLRLLALWIVWIGTAVLFFGGFAASERRRDETLERTL